MKICIVVYRGCIILVKITYEFDKVILIKIVCICCLSPLGNVKTFAEIHYLMITKSVNFSSVCSKKYHVTGNELHCLNKELWPFYNVKKANEFWMQFFIVFISGSITLNFWWREIHAKLPQEIVACTSDDV